MFELEEMLAQAYAAIETARFAAWRGFVELEKSEIALRVIKRELLFASFV